MSQYRVLIVDDDLKLLRSLRETILNQQMGAEVLTAASGEEALELLALAEVQALVADREMPGLDGVSLITEVKKRWPDVRCALMAAKGDERARVVGRLAGACAIIDKPFEARAFVEHLRDLLPSAGFTGTRLTGFNLTDLLQLVAMSGQQMTLRIERGERCGELSLAQGSLVHAVAGEREGVDAAKEILSWRDGQVLSTPGVLPKTEWTVDVAIMELLVDAARLDDENHRDDVRAELEGLQAGLLDRDGVFATALLHADSGEEAIAASASADFDRTKGVSLLLEMHRLVAATPPDVRPRAICVTYDDFRITAVPVLEGNILQVAWTVPEQYQGDISARVQQLAPALELALPKLLMDFELDLGDAFSESTESSEAGRFEVVGS